MTLKEILFQRLFNQQLRQPEFKSSEKLISSLCAIQAQDYPSSKWALGIRLPCISNADVEREITGKKIIRTWLMRGTLHLVSSKDIRWLLQLLSKRIIAANGFRYKQLAFDANTFSQFEAGITNVLRNRKQFTREELIPLLAKRKLTVNKEQLSHLLHWASLEQIVCHGAKNNNLFTFTLLDEWVPNNKKFNRDEAIAELTKRYFINRGPASLNDFIWWSGLSSTDAKAGIEMIESLLHNETINNVKYYFSKTISPSIKNIPSVFLLPAFDEYIIAYKDRSLFIKPEFIREVITMNGLFKPAVLIDGKVACTWRSIVKKDKMRIEINSFAAVSNTNRHKIENAAESYCKFTGKEFEQLKFTVV